MTDGAATTDVGAATGLGAGDAGVSDGAYSARKSGTVAGVAGTTAGKPSSFVNDASVTDRISGSDDDAVCGRIDACAVRMPSE
jgi:hypothetical protein